MPLSFAWRHRLGFTLSGASPSTNAYASKSHTVSPSGPVTFNGASVAMKPRRASSKDCISPSGSAPATVRLASTVCEVAAPDESAVGLPPPPHAASDAISVKASSGFVTIVASPRSFGAHPAATLAVAARQR